MSRLPGSTIPLFKMRVEEKGRIKDIKEIIVRIDGFPSCLNGQLVDLGDDTKGIVMGYDDEEVLVLALSDPGRLRMGREVVSISEPFKIPVSSQMVGRMVTALGLPCDHGGDIEAETRLPVFRDSPPIIHRSSMNEPLFLGTKMVDMAIPISKGQRQLILGDRVTGKTVVAIDAILNQRGRNVICVYCCVGKSMSGLEKAIALFHEFGALEYTIMVAATDNAPVGEQYIVPFSAATVADFFAAKGRDVLVVFDDLTKHAWAYRQLSLLLERPPGREAYPGDIFYVQTQLMERAGKFNEANGGGSITYLGVAETLQNDLTGYIPSNLASMCDGQIYLNSAIFAEGIRPAIDVGLSISIIGGKTQPKILKKLGRNVRSDFAKYMEIMRLSKMSSGLSGEAELIVRKGETLRDLFQQMEHIPVSLAGCVLLLYAYDKELILNMTKQQRMKFSDEIVAFATANHPELLQKIDETRELTVEIELGLAALMTAYFTKFEGV